MAAQSAARVEEQIVKLPAPFGGVRFSLSPVRKSHPKATAERSARLLPRSRGNERTARRHRPGALIPDQRQHLGIVNEQTARVVCGFQGEPFVSRPEKRESRQRMGDPCARQRARWRQVPIARLQRDQNPLILLHGPPQQPGSDKLMEAMKKLYDRNRPRLGPDGFNQWPLPPAACHDDANRFRNLVVELFKADDRRIAAHFERPGIRSDDAYARMRMKKQSAQRNTLIGFNCASLSTLACQPSSTGTS